MEWDMAKESSFIKMEDVTKAFGVKIQWMDLENFIINQIK